MMKEILFVQLPPPRFSFEEPPVNIPLAAGFLASALGSCGSGSWSPGILGTETADVFADEGLALQIAELRPAALGLTLYLWNVQRSLFLAANVKRLSPGTLVVIGGPEVTRDNEWVLSHPAVDGGVFGEGESRIAAILDALTGKVDPRDIPGSFFKDARGLHVNGAREAPWDPGACPYPYLDGTVGPARDGTLFLETVRGCPFRCRYCYYRKTFDGVRTHPRESVEAVLDFAYAEDSPVREIYLMDPTFNARPDYRDLLGSMSKRRSNKDVALHAELRADVLNGDAVRLMKDAGLKSAEVGLQSFNPTALRAAGRSGDPDSTARGARLLKSEGVEVTTGIILGLPEDTPEGFSRTLSRLKGSQAYSTVQPFILSVLPGTDFRARAECLGLDYDPRPPYYVRSTRTFPAEGFQTALFECERIFDMELDHIPPPSLVDRGPAVVSDPQAARRLSKWIVSPRAEAAWRRVLPSVTKKATDPFTIWFRDPGPSDAAVEIIRDFVMKNPHTVLNVVWDFGEPPPADLLERVLDAAADPYLYVNRAYAPLYSEGAVVTPDFSVILPDPGDPALREEITRRIIHLARPVWETADMIPPLDAGPPGPFLVDPSPPAEEESFFRRVEARFSEDPRAIMFRDQRVQEIWDRRSGRFGAADPYRETILVTGPVGTRP
jgi:hypothetical protein